MTGEKRRFSRIMFHVRASLETGTKTFDFDRITNLSVGGCLVELTDAGSSLSLGQEVVFRIFLEHMSPAVVVNGEIVRMEKREIGVRFTMIDPENLFHLQNIIRYNAENTVQIEKELKKHPGLK